MLQALEAREVPATFTVNLADDTNAGLGGTSTGVNTGDLRWCFEQARVGGADDIIAFSSGVTTTLAAALPMYTDNAALTINGQGKSATTIVAPANNRIFDFNVPGATPLITITDLKLQGGNVTLGYGGAIRDDNEVMVLTNVAFAGNKAVSGGGAISFTSAVASITLTGCDFTGNTATTITPSGTTGGGAIYVGGAATVKLDSTMFDGNRATSGSAMFTASSININSDSSTFKNGQSFGTTGNSGGALFLQSGASTVTINNATVTGNTTLKDGGFLYAFSTGSSITMQNSTFTNNSAGSRGGVLRTFSTSSVNVLNCTFTNNSATGIGGALNPGGQFFVAKSTFTGNSAGGIGGAIYGGSTATIMTSIFSNNTSTSTTGGGAVRVTSASTINFSQFTSNTSSGSGGAIYYSSGTVTVNNSTFSKNTAALNGGAIHSSSSGSMTVNQSTFTKNTASGSGVGLGGGAIAATGAGPLLVNNSTIYDNLADGASTATGGGGILRTTSTSSVTLNLISTIVANNLLPNGTVGIDLYSSASTTSIAGTKNLIGTNDLSSITFATPASNQIGTNASKINAKLGSLVDNGGEASKVLQDGSFVKTMGLLNGSPALNQGLANGFTDDQRGVGFARDDGFGVDVGAFEGGASIPAAQLTSAPPVTSLGNGSYSFDVTYDDDSGFNTTTFDTDDVIVTGQGYGAGQKATAHSVAGSGKTYVVTYTIPAPTGGWGGINGSNVFNIGEYTVTMNPSQVSDDSANFVPTDVLGTFKTSFGLALSVDQNSDNDDNNLSPGQLSFREALRVANSNAGLVDTITFASTTFNAASTIALTAGPRTISDSVIIAGPTVSLTMNAGTSNQQFTISPNQSVTISKLEFTGFSAASAGAVISMGAGTISLSQTVFSKNTSTSGGAAVLAVTTGAASVNIITSHFSQNSSNTSGGALRFNAGSQSSVTISNSTFSGNTSGSTGGAIYASTLSSVTITNSTFTNNRATTGGALRFNSNTSSVTINSSTFSNNTTTSSSGGAADLNGSVIINDSSFTGNTAGTSGGALYLGALNTSATISRTIFSNNTAASGLSGGGAIRAGSVTMSVTSSQFTNNTTAGAGGAISGINGSSITLTSSTFRGNTAGGSGGAVNHAAPSTMLINQSTFNNNTAAGAAGGGAIGHSSAGASAMVINNSTIYGNTASGSSTAANGGGIVRIAAISTLTLISTIVSNNKVTGSGTGGVDLYSVNPTNLTAGTAHHNLIGNNDNSNVSFDDVTTNLLGTTASPIDAKLSPIGDYGGGVLLPSGGHVQTMPLLPGSPALDVGDANGFANDQRGAGFPRVVNGGIANQADIGAAEGVLLPPTVTSVVFGDGTVQRSLVKQIVVTFSEAVTFMGDVTSAFTLSRTGTGGTLGDVQLVASPPTGPASSVTITFTGAPLTEFGSLVDGFYDFMIDAAEVSGAGGALDGNNDTIPGGSYSVVGNTTNKFFRMYGDADGNATTSLSDFAAFRNVFNLGPSTIFDFDNDNNVGLSDFAAFRGRFNLSP